MLLLPGSSAIALLLLSIPSPQTNGYTIHTPIRTTPTFAQLLLPTKPRRGTHHRSSLSDQGWKNDNFLDALSSTASPSSPSSGPDYEALENVNAQYNRESESRAAFRQRQFQMMMNESGEDGGGPDPAFGGAVDGMPESPPKIVPVEEESQGGSMFKEMMAKAEMAKAGGGGRRATASPAVDAAPVLQEQQQQQPAALSQPPPPVAVQSQQTVDAQAYYQLQLQSWQQQMATYAQFIAVNPEAAATITMPPPPPPPPAIGTALQPQQATIAPLTPPPQTPPQPLATTEQPEAKNPRDYLPPNPNRNSDAYEITNSADIYLAQLKRDTAVRNWARQDGETEKSNQPFADVGVQAIGGLLSDDLVEKRREQRKNEAESGVNAEQMKMIEGLQAEDKRRMEESEERDRVLLASGQSGVSGLSYRERLEEAKRKKSGGGVTPPPQQPAVTVSPVTIADPVDKLPPPPPQQPAVTVSPVTIADPADRVAPPPPQQPAVTVSPVTIADPAARVAPPPPQQPAVTVTPFTFPTDPITTSTTTTQTPPTTSFPDMENPDTEGGTPQLNFALPVKDENSIAPVSAPSSSDSDDTRRSLRTLMGLILKHRGGPGFGSGRLKPNEAGRLVDSLGEVLGMLRVEVGLEAEVEDAMLEAENAAATTADEDILAVDVGALSSSSMSPPLLNEGVLACVKGAISAFESTQQEGLLMPLRNALLNAASAINTVIAEGEVENARLYEAVSGTPPSPSPPPTPAPAPQAQVVPVKREEQMVVEISEEVPIEKQSAADDIGSPNSVSNTARLQEAYDTLKASEGGGKFGLKKGISEREISHVSEVLSDMRTVIMEELDTGIPEPLVSQTVEIGSTTATSVPSGERRVDVAAGEKTTTNTPSTTGGSSKYEQMLAKAKAEEVLRKN